MSMENAILELAASLRYLADSNRRDLAGSAVLIQASEKVTDALVQDKAAELADATAQRAAAARDAEKKDAAANAEVQDGDVTQAIPREVIEQAKKDAELAAAVQKVEDDAKAEKQGATAEADTVVLDYAKDVRPVLLLAIKAGKRPEIEAKLKEFGAAKADALKPEQLPAMLEFAQALAA